MSFDAVNNTTTQGPATVVDNDTGGRRIHTPFRDVSPFYRGTSGGLMGLSYPPPLPPPIPPPPRASRLPAKWCAPNVVVVRDVPRGRVVFGFLCLVCPYDRETYHRIQTLSSILPESEPRTTRHFGSHKQRASELFRACVLVDNACFGPRTKQSGQSLCRSPITRPHRGGFAEEREKRKASEHGVVQVQQHRKNNHLLSRHDDINERT